MIIPAPAIWPSSESPRYEVGINEEKPTAVAAAASAKGTPALPAAVLRAVRRFPPVVTFGAVTHAELEPEIDAEPDEQHEKGHGNQV